MSAATQQLVPAVDRAVRMLSDLSSTAAGKRISDLARDLDIPKSSAFQIAATLVHHGLLECDDDTRRYRLGQGLRHIVGAREGRVDLPLLWMIRDEGVGERRPQVHGIAEAPAFPAEIPRAAVAV